LHGLEAHVTDACVTIRKPLYRATILTHLCAAIFVDDPEQARRDALQAAEAGADLIELRIDRFTSDPEALKQVIAQCPLPCIVTARADWEGGETPLSELDRLALLSGPATAGATYIDLELEALREAPGLFTGRKLILSSHDFEGRPERLYNVLAEMASRPDAIAKVAWMARTVRDNIEAFEILKSRTQPTIALCMGEAGLISRVLAKKFGAFLTFAGVRRAEVTAPGQITVEEMKRLFRWDAIQSSTKVFGVVASPVAHSMSPAIHNAAFDETNFDGVYVPLLVNEGYESFKAFMESALVFAPLDLSGLSVTLPHKENALAYLREKNAHIDPLAASIGAVNTIVIEPGEAGPSLRGLNTDYSAILDSITNRLGITRHQLDGVRVAVIGAGGTGRTAVAALAHYGATIVVYNRTLDRAQALAAEFNGRRGKVVAAPLDKLCASCCQVYINTTSVGMHPNSEVSAFGDELPRLGADTLVFDCVYNPMQTKMLKQADAAGAQTIGGVEMFVRQAVSQFEAWTKLKAPDDVMRRVVEKRLSAQAR